jgi:hypothetical protein
MPVDPTPVAHIVLNHHAVSAVLLIVLALMVLIVGENSA